MVEQWQARLSLPLLLSLLFLRRFRLEKGVMVAPVVRIVLQRAQPLEGLFIGTISDLAEQFIDVYKRQALFNVTQIAVSNIQMLGCIA